MNKIQLIIANKLKEGVLMMAMFYAQRVILGKQPFSSVPEKLKEKVKEILIDSGMEELTETQ